MGMATAQRDMFWDGKDRSGSDKERIHPRPLAAASRINTA